MRLFIAVNLTRAVRQSIRQAIDRFPVADPPWRWVADEALHITLKFLGETKEDLIPGLATHLETVCRRRECFAIRLGELGGFPSLSRPRVIFYRVEEGFEALTGLASEIDEILGEELAIAREERSFRAHVTIARIKKPLPRAITSEFEKMQALSNVTQTVSSVDIMRSELRREGAKYHMVKEIALLKAT